MSTYWTDSLPETLRTYNPWYRPDRNAEATSGQSPAVSGINVCGYFRDESGWGAAGRGYIRAIQSSNISYSLLDLSAMSSNRSHDTSVGPADTSHPYGINLVCVDPGQHYSFAQHVGDTFLEGRYNIGAWAWELPRFPERWLDRLVHYDEIWVTTSFVANLLAPVSPVPVIRIPPVLRSPRTGSRERGRAKLHASNDEFLTLFIFDFHSHMERKNPLAVTEAFKRALGAEGNARLVIKCVNGDADPAGLQALTAATRSHRIEVHDGYWSSTNMADLMAACDVYVSLHRSEGTGLTITDAMAAGKPVIATGWSGNMDFMTVANSYPVRYRLVSLDRNVGPYQSGEIWAEPSIEHAAQQLHHVYTDRADAQDRAEAARCDIDSMYSETAIGNLIRSRLDVIAHRNDLPRIREEIKAYTAGYRQLSHEINDIVRTVIPAGAVALVISRGDPELIALDGREGRHFPHEEDGTYLGYHPADGAAAIAYLEGSCAAGAEYLIIPGTSFWWLDHYTDFARHLGGFMRVWSDERCAIYNLTGQSAMTIPTECGQ